MVLVILSESLGAAQTFATKHGYEIEEHSLVLYVRPKKKRQG